MEGGPVEATGVIEGSRVAERGITDPLPMIADDQGIDGVGVFPAD